MQASLQTTANEWAAGRFWTHMEGRHAQGPGTIGVPNQYRAWCGQGSKIQRTWFGGRDRGKIYF